MAQVCYRTCANEVVAQNSKYIYCICIACHRRAITPNCQLKFLSNCVMIPSLPVAVVIIILARFG